VNSVILRTATQLLLTILLLFSFFLTLRGHDLPGGGFIGGLVASAAVALYAIAFGHKAAVAMLRIAPGRLVGVGLAAAVAAGFLSLPAGNAFLTGQWLFVTVGGLDLKLSSPLLFDVGVYLVVVGTVLTMLFALEER
jgi:multicomponent Na+:H+ antiporter subunit B